MATELDDLLPPLVVERRLPEHETALAALAVQLSQRSALSAGDVAAVMRLSATVRHHQPFGYVIREGEPPKHAVFLRSGIVFRHKVTSEGARQILSLHMPGDTLDFQNLYSDVSDHNIQALTAIEVLTVPRAELQGLIEQRPAIAHAVIVNLTREASIAREWLLNVGRRKARARVAHFLCEFAARMDAAGLAPLGSYELPMTQEQLGDALGLTSVHVNRTLRSLEAEGVVTRSGRHIQFDWHQMCRIADFSALYLRLRDPAPAE